MIARMWLSEPLGMEGSMKVGDMWGFALDKHSGKIITVLVRIDAAVEVSKLPGARGKEGKGSGGAKGGASKGKGKAGRGIAKNV